MIQRLPVSWVVRATPLAPTAAIASGSAALALARRLLDSSERDLTRHVAVADGPLIAVRAETLPWVEGVVYLGVDETADGLLLPTTLRPDVPSDVFARAVFERYPRAARPLGVVLENGRARVLPLGDARPLDAAALRTWLESRA